VINAHVACTVLPSASARPRAKAAPRQGGNTATQNHTSDAVRRVQVALYLTPPIIMVSFPDCCVT